MHIYRRYFLRLFFLLSSEINSNDPNQSTHIISHQEVDIQLTNRINRINETTPINDANQVDERK